MRGVMRLHRRTTRAAFAAALVLAVAGGVAARAATTVPEITNLTVTPSRFCAKASSSCGGTGTTVHFHLSTAATVTANIWPRFRNQAGYFEWRRHFGAGNVSTRLNDPRLTPGRWTFKVQGINNVGSGTTANVDVRVVK
jgi:hypothetical protein